MNYQTDNTEDMFQSERDEKLKFVLKRIVFVNSANHGYSEIMLDNHLALFGSNNAGKTASLAGTKLMLYPETDFSKCESKFKFRGKEGAYSKEDSYDFYFPSDQSFMVMEIENDIGTSCIVLYPARNYSYHRVFLPLSYDDVRPLFWDSECRHFADEISIDKLLRFCKQHNGIQVSERKRLKELMYSNIARHDSRYCVVPLSDNKSNSIKAFSNIYQMAFDSGSKQNDSLAESIATLVDIKRGRPEERLSADILSIEEKYTTLLRQRDEVDILKNNQDIYQNLRETFDQLNKQYIDYSKCYQVLRHELTQQVKNHTSNFAEISKELKTAQDNKTELETQQNISNSKISQLRGAIELLKSQRQEHNKNKFIAETIMSEYGEMNSKTLSMEFQSQLKELGQQRQALQNQEQAKIRIERLTNELKQNNAQLSELKNTERNLDKLLLNQLPVDVASVLYSLNTDFNQIVTNITPTEKQQVQEFTKLFSTHQHKLNFKQVTLENTNSQNFDSRVHAKWLEERITELENQVKYKQKEISELNIGIKDTSGDFLKTKLGKNKKDIDDLQPKIIALKKYENLIDYDLPNTEKSISDNETELTELQNQLKECKTNLVQASQIYENFKSRQQRLNDQGFKFEKYQNDLKNALQNLPYSFAHTLDDEQILDYQKQYDIQLAIENTESLSRKSSQLSTEKSSLHYKLQKFIDNVPNEKIDKYKTINTLEDINHIILSFQLVFSTLEHKRITLDNDIANHNNIINSQLKEIADNKSLLHDTMSEINKELNGHKVSNLREVKLKLETHADFDNIVKLYESHDMQDKALMSQEFYDSLRKYITKHLDKTTRLLKIRNIIKSIQFTYRLANGEFTEKGQSGGTTSTIKASVIAILLNRIFRTDYSLKMPIIIDEIADLDDGNTKTIIDCIEEHGFSAFCATPTLKTSVCICTDRWIDIDYKVMENQPMVEDCTLVILPESIERWGQKSSNAKLNNQDNGEENEVMYENQP